MRLLYCASPVLGVQAVPGWVNRLSEFPRLQEIGLVPYTPLLGIQEQLNFPGFKEALGQPVNNWFHALRGPLRLGQSMFAPLEKILPDLISIENRDGGLLASITLDTYALIRSAAMVVDLGFKTGGECSAEVMLAHFGRIPIVGMTDRFVHSPWMAQAVAFIIASPTNSDCLLDGVEAALREAARNPGPPSSLAPPSVPPSSSEPPVSSPGAGLSEDFAQQVVAASEKSAQEWSEADGKFSPDVRGK